MSEESRPNGKTVRTFEHRGHQVSEVSFTIHDVGEGFLGYMVGENTGYGPLYTTPDEAVTVHEGSGDHVRIMGG